MGAAGEDILFSKEVGDQLGISIECKSRESMAVYSFYSQAKDNCPAEREPVVVIKQNKSKPLVVVDAVYYVQLLSSHMKEEADSIGTLNEANGDRYVGEFRDGKMHGQGTLIDTYGKKYVGAFIAGKRHGKGTLSWPTGKKYVGEFRDDKILDSDIKLKGES